MPMFSKGSWGKKFLDFLSNLVSAKLCFSEGSTKIILNYINNVSSFWYRFRDN